MPFAWQGFQFDIPSDWGPVSLTGNYEEGYVRLCSDGPVECLVRWKASKTSVDLSVRLEAYLERLSRDAEKKKIAFRSEVEATALGMDYHYNHERSARGAIFQSPTCGRVFFLEVSGRQKEQLNASFAGIVGTFSSEDADRRRWALLGLDVWMPRGATIARQEFRAGKTELVFGAKGTYCEATRWGLAEQLLHAHSLADWSRASLRFPEGDLVEEQGGLLISRKRRMFRPARTALVRPQLAQNQITTISVESNRSTWRPQWDWFAG